MMTASFCVPLQFRHWRKVMTMTIWLRLLSEVYGCCTWSL